MNLSLEIITTIAEKLNTPQTAVDIAQDICDRAGTEFDIIGSGFAASVDLTLRMMQSLQQAYQPIPECWALTLEFYEIVLPCTNCAIMDQRNKLIQVLEADKAKKQEENHDNA